MATTAATTAAVAAAGPPREIRAFKPVADAYVTEARPRGNFGRAKVLRVDAEPLTTTYLRFHIEELKGEISSVTLLLHANRAGRTSYEVRRVDNDRWREGRLTFENAPRLSLRYAASKPVRRGAWSAVDVTSFVDRDDDDISLAITTRGDREVSFHSRESRYGPRLVFRTQDKDPDPARAVPRSTGA